MQLPIMLEMCIFTGYSIKQNNSVKVFFDWEGFSQGLVKEFYWLKILSRDWLMSFTG